MRPKAVLVLACLILLKSVATKISRQPASKKVIEINQQHELGYITDNERYRLVIKNWLEIDQEIQELVDQQFGDYRTSLNLIVDSKARGTVNLGQIKRMIASIGAINDTSGRTLELPVKSNYFAGLPILEYFVAARGARKSLVDVALLTAESGHLTRRLVFVAQEVITVADSKEIVDPGFSIFREDCRRMDTTLAARIINRYAAEDMVVDDQVVVESGQLIDKEAAAKIEASELRWSQNYERFINARRFTAFQLKVTALIWPTVSWSSATSPLVSLPPKASVSQALN